MNYRHIYHAGSFTDVFKHCVLLALIKSLHHKDKPFCYLDTHSGIGRYDLQSIEAGKTQEACGGIYRLLNTRQSEQPAIVQEYLAIVRSLNTSDKMRYYPGSPRVVRSLLRAGDRMVLCELHHQDVVTLKKEFTNDKQVAVHHIDGYSGLKAFLPPKENRGLVLIDPPFEKDNEFKMIIENLTVAIKHWANGIYAIWYPIKQRREVDSFLRKLQSQVSEKLLVTELAIPAVEADALNACGMAIINPPWKIEQELKSLQSWLSQVL